MAAQPEWQSLVNYFRFAGQVGTSEVFNGIAYWTDEQLENILLEHARPTSTSLAQLYDGDPRFFEMTCAKHYKFASDFRLFTDRRKSITTIHDYDVRNNTVTFTNDTVNGLVVEGYAVHMWDALADLWDKRAAQRYDNVDWKAGHNTMYMDQQYKHCIQMRDYYRGRVIRRLPR